MFKVSIMVTMLIMFILTCTSESVQEPYPYIKESYIPVPSNESDSLVIYINNERVLNGLPELIQEKLLTSICEEKCDDMIRTKNVTHEGLTNRFEKSNALVLLENLGYGFSTDNALCQAYMNSPKHRENILNRNVTHIGIYTKQKYNCCLFAKYQTTKN
jgi:uncharacterized protein YkwD